MRHHIRQIVQIAALAVFLGACAHGTDNGRTNTSRKEVTVTVQEETAQPEDASDSASSDEKTMQQERKDASETAAAEKDTDTVKDTGAEKGTDIYPAPDFTLTDQYGTTHTLSGYKGQIVFLNFWATWCPPCRAEMPDIHELCEEYQSTDDDSVVILGIAAPGTVDDRDVSGVTDFLRENGYTYPVVMDLTGEMFEQYYIMAYPTTFMIDADGNIFGYVQGMMTEEVMRDIIAQTLTGIRTDG